jgi:hypothetical protein
MMMTAANNNNSTTQQDNHNSYQWQYPTKYIPRWDKWQMRQTLWGNTLRQLRSEMRPCKQTICFVPTIELFPPMQDPALPALPTNQQTIFYQDETLQSRMLCTTMMQPCIVNQWTIYLLFPSLVTLVVLVWELLLSTPCFVYHGSGDPSILFRFLVFADQNSELLKSLWANYRRTKSSHCLITYSYEDWPLAFDTFHWSWHSDQR